MTTAKHGTKYRYQLGCRDECCTRANTRALKLWRAGLTSTLVDATGTKRRIQALIAMGWTLQEVSTDAGGYTKNWCHLILNQETVTSTTAAKIAAVYERLSMTVPTGPYRQRTRSRAARNGWLPPLAWDDIDTDEAPPVADETKEIDPVVVERILAGDWRCKTTLAERYEVIRQWSRPDLELERHTGWNVARLRRKMAAREAEEREVA